MDLILSEDSSWHQPSLSARGSRPALIPLPALPQTASVPARPASCAADPCVPGPLETGQGSHYPDQVAMRMDTRRAASYATCCLQPDKRIMTVPDIPNGVRLPQRRAAPPVRFRGGQGRTLEFQTVGDCLPAACPGKAAQNTPGTLDRIPNVDRGAILSACGAPSLPRKGIPTGAWCLVPGQSKSVHGPGRGER